MIAITQPINNLLGQLSEAIGLLDNEQFTMPISALSGATIGQHTRHIIEFFTELSAGYNSGVINYDRRERDHQIETSKHIALRCLQEIASNLDKPDKALVLIVDFNDTTDGAFNIRTNYYRELAYNLEHIVHHMALLRIGINALLGVNLPTGFGVAASTLKFRQACAR